MVRSSPRFPSRGSQARRHPGVDIPMQKTPLTPPVRPIASCKLACAAGVVVAGLLAAAQPAHAQQRSLGIDISAWQGNIAQTTWNGLHTVDDRDFVFIRSSRGGTTGYYNQNNADNDNPVGQNTFSQRYDDPYFVQNITRATAAGMYAGAYHFTRPDIIASTLNSNGIANTGADEADHFIQMAGPWMRPGYLLPVHDLEAGQSQRTGTQLSQFTVDFSNRINEVMGIRPIVYASQSYANYINSTVPAVYPNLWLARWPQGSGAQFTGNTQTDQPPPSPPTSNVYGKWNPSWTVSNPYPNGHPWTIWQYSSGELLQSYTGRLDGDVANGGVEFLKDLLVPAVWMNNSNGNWSALGNWNSGQTPVAPVQGPGQVARVGSMVLPTPRLPGAAGSGVTAGVNDTVLLDRSAANITVTFDNTVPATSFRRLQLNERLVVTGSTLDVSLTGFAGAGGQLALSGGTTTIEQAQFNTGSTLEFGGAGTLTVGSLVLNTDVTYNGASGMGLINGKTVSTPAINLGAPAAGRSFNVGDGSSAVDLRVALPIANGNLNKDGAGTLELTGNNAAYTGTLTVNNGYLLVSGVNQLGTTGVRTTQTSTTTGGTVRLDGGITINNTAITIAGLGFNNSAAFENLSGNNTWSGPVNLAGTGTNQTDVGLNQIGAAAGTLTLSGVIQNSGTGARSWAKTGAGDVVLTGASANTYNNITRLFAGRLILEKNGALGTAGSSSIADGNTFQLPGGVSTLAFRAPTGSSSLNYSNVEWIHTEGTGVSGLGQIDNLGGDNLFAGNLGLGGPTSNNIQQASIGVSAGSLELQGGLYARSIVAPEARGITKLGAGTLILSGDSGPAPSNGQDKSLINSSFNVSAGTVNLKGTSGNTANVPGVTSWTVGNNALLSVQKTNATGGAALNLAGGTFQTTAAAGANTAASLAVDPAGAGGTVDISGTSLGVTGAFSIGAGKSLAKNGAGTLDINGSQSHGAGATLNANVGTTNLNTDAGTSAARNLAVNVGGGGATVNFNAIQHLASLNITTGGRANIAPAGGANLLVTGSLNIDANGILNTGDNDLLVDYAPGGTSPYKRISSYAINAFLNRPGGVIRAGELSFDRMLAVSDNNALGLSSWDNENIDLSTVIGKYVFFGDSNLDGAVTASDYDALTATGNRAAGGWRLGDYTYDGLVTYMDYAAIDANLGKGIDDPSLALLRESMIAQHAAMFGDPYRTALAEAEGGNFAYLFGAAVPEPSTAALLLLAGGAGTLARRRRR